MTSEQKFNYILIDVNRPFGIMYQIAELTDCVKRYIDYRNRELVRTRHYNLIWVRARTFFNLCKDDIRS